MKRRIAFLAGSSAAIAAVSLLAAPGAHADTVILDRTIGTQKMLVIKADGYPTWGVVAGTVSTNGGATNALVGVGCVQGPPQTNLYVGVVAGNVAQDLPPIPLGSIACPQ